MGQEAEPDRTLHMNGLGHADHAKLGIFRPWSLRREATNQPARRRYRTANLAGVVPIPPSGGPAQLLPRTCVGTRLTSRYVGSAPLTFTLYTLYCTGYTIIDGPNRGRSGYFAQVAYLLP
jgi:hypothetical protein